MLRSFVARVRPLRHLFIVAALLSIGACAPSLALVKSVPSETDFDHTRWQSAHALWPQMIARAKHTIDLAQFYVTSSDAGSDALSPILRALIAAVQRGVTVRLLVDESMAGVYPQELERLARKGIVVRRLDLRSLTGGVQHAKYFVIDDREAFIGSQNFDWRSLEHIHEMGVHLRNQTLARALTAVFDSDWALAAAQPAPPLAPASVITQQSGEVLRIDLVISPQKMSPEAAWELPAIVEMIANAQRSIRIELLLYRGPHQGDRDTPMAQIEQALIAAAARGVRVEILFSDWMLRDSHKQGLRGLRDRPGIAVKIVTIPRSTKGDIPFARLIHAKYLAVDESRFWLGSSNWEDRYFLRSRNVSLRVSNRRLCRELEQMFDALWASPYATPPSP